MSTAGRFSILTSAFDPRAAAIFTLPDDLPDPMRLSLGEPLEDSYPGDVTFRMADEVRGMRVPDLIHNALGFMMISERFMSLLEERASVEIEFLPFTLLNHKGRIAVSPCFLANPLGALDCADAAQTVGTPNPLLPGQLMLIRRLVLDEDRIPADQNLGRVSINPEIIVVRDDLRAAIEAAGMTGIHFVDQGAVRL